MEEREQATGGGLFFFSFCYSSLLRCLPCLSCLLLLWTLFLVWLMLLVVMLVLLASGARRWGWHRYGGADIQSAVGTAACSTRSTIRRIPGTGTSTTTSGSGGRGGGGGSGLFDLATTMSSSSTAAVSAEARIWAVVLRIQRIGNRS